MEIFKYEFIRNALLATIFVNIACGIVGTYVVTKKIVFISGGISHAAFGGIGLGFFLGLNPILVAIPFSIASALSIGIISKKTKINEDTAIGIIWAIGMAIGILFINLTPGYTPDLFSYLFGNILTVAAYDLYIMVGLDLFIVIVAFIFHREFSALSFDEEYSEVIGIPVRVLYFLLLCLVALSVVILIRIVGIILTIALLTIPSSICRQFTYNIKKLIIYSIIIGVLTTALGIFLSYILNISSGATIIIFSGFVFLISMFVKFMINIRRKAKLK